MDAEPMIPADFARFMGVNRSTVSRWIKKGRIVVRPDGRIDPQAAGMALNATESPYPHHQARLEQIAAEKAAGAAQDGASGRHGGMDRADAGLRLAMARARREEEQARLAEMDRMERERRLVPVETVEYLLRDFGATLHNLAARLPSRIAHEVAGCGGGQHEIQRIVEDAMHDLHHDLEQHMARKASEKEIAK